MPWRVDQVDFHALPVDGNVLGQNRDSPLPLKVTRVEDSLAVKLAGAELPALTEQAVDQCRLAMVDVGDDGDIPDVAPADHRGGDGRFGGSGHEGIQWGAVRPSTGIELPAGGGCIIQAERMAA